MNLAFQNFLINDLKESCKTTFIDLGACSLHTADNAFGKLAKEINGIVYVDQMAIDFHFFLKYCTGRREDFAKCQK